MIKSLVLAISSGFRTSLVEIIGARDAGTDQLKVMIRNEFTAFFYKILIGIICVSMLVFSFTQLAYAFEAYLMIYRNGFIIEVCSFIFVIMICLTGLYFLFKPKMRNNKQKSIVEFVPVVRADTDFQNISKNFIQGLVTGLMRSRINV